MNEPSIRFITKYEPPSHSTGKMVDLAIANPEFGRRYLAAMDSGNIEELKELALIADAFFRQRFGI